MRRLSPGTFQLSFWNAKTFTKAKRDLGAHFRSNRHVKNPEPNHFEAPQELLLVNVVNLPWSFESENNIATSENL